MASKKQKKTRGNGLPGFFKPLFWSYKFSTLDLEKDKKTIVINTLNYGDLPHWRWITAYYGKKEIKKILAAIPETELRERVRPLIALMFGMMNIGYAYRGPR